MAVSSLEIHELRHEIKKNTELLRELLARQMFNDHMHRNHPSGWHNWDLLPQSQQEDYYKRVDVLIKNRVGEYKWVGGPL